MANAQAITPSVCQFRYYGVGKSQNYPDDTSWIGSNSDGSERLNLLDRLGGNAVKIGIQTLPGVKFYISDSSTANSIIIDHTGVYELDLRNTTTTISSLYFEPESLFRISEVGNASLIVDILYNSSEGSVNS